MSASLQNTSLTSLNSQEILAQVPSCQQDSARDQINSIEAFESALKASEQFEDFRKRNPAPAKELSVRLEIIELLNDALELPLSFEQIGVLRDRLVLYCSYAVTELQKSDSPRLEEARHYQILSLRHSEVACREASKIGSEGTYVHWLSNAAFGYRNLSIIYKKLGQDIDRLEIAEKSIVYFKYLIEVSEDRILRGDPELKRLNQAHLLRNCATQMQCLAEDYKDLSETLKDSEISSALALLTRAFGHAADAVRIYDKLAAQSFISIEKSKYQSARQKLIQLATILYKSLQEQ